jgi:hypothetical protein
VLAFTELPDSRAVDVIAVVGEDAPGTPTPEGAA